MEHEGMSREEFRKAVSGSGRKENPYLPVPVEGQGVVTHPVAGPGMAEKAGAQDWLRRVEQASQEGGEVWAGAEKQAGKLNVDTLRKILATGRADTAEYQAARNEWGVRVAALGGQYENITGSRFGEYILARVSGNKPTTGSDLERQRRADEFDKYLETRPDLGELIQVVVKDEKEYMSQRNEKTEQDESYRLSMRRVPVLAEEDFGVKKSRGVGGEGVEIKAKPIWQMDQAEREAKFEEEVQKHVKQEVEEAKKTGGTIEAKKVADKLLETSKYWGLALLADELVEFVEDKVKHGEIESPNLLREFRKWNEERKGGKGTKPQEAKPQEEKPAEARPTEEEEEKRREVQKEEPEVKEVKERSGEKWDKYQNRITEITDKETSGKVLLPSEIRERDDLKKKRDAIWNEYKEAETDVSRQMHVPWKDYVASSMDSTIKNDMDMAALRRTMPDANFGRSDPLEDVLSRLDPTINGITNYTDRSEKESIQRDWFMGAKRNIELAALKAEFNMYKGLDLLDKPEWQERVAEIQARLGVLQKEVEHLNWGNISENTIKRLSDLSAAYTGYLEDAGPRADELKEARRQQKLKEAAANAPKSPENGNTLEQMNTYLISALFEGEWKDTGPQSAQGKVQLWIDGNGRHPEVGRIKAQKALIDWVQNASGGDMEKAMKVSGLDSEKMEALEGRAELLLAKRKILEVVGFNFDAEVVDPQTHRKRKITAKDIREGNYPSDPTEFLNKELPLITRQGQTEPVSFWTLKPNEYSPAIWAMAEKVAEEMSAGGPRLEKDDPKVLLATLTALRQLQHSGIFSMYHTEYSPHPFVIKEMTMAMHPGDAYLAMLDSNAKELNLPEGKKPAHYNLISQHREWFARRDFKTGQYDRSKFKKVPGYEDMTWNELVMPPEPLKSYLFEDTVFADKSTLWERWDAGRITATRQEFNAMGPLRISGFRRDGASRLWEEFFAPIESGKTWNTNGPFLKDIGTRMAQQMKAWGMLIGPTDRIETEVHKPERQKEIADLARFEYTRGEVFMLEPENEGKLNRWSFDALKLGIAMMGYEIDKRTAKYREDKSIYGDRSWSYGCTVEPKGWWVDVSSSEDGGKVRVSLLDQKMVRWLEKAGVSYPKDESHKLFPRVEKWLREDAVANALIHIRTMGLPDEPIKGWGGINVSGAFERGFERSRGKNRRERIMVWGLGARTGDLEPLMKEIDVLPEKERAELSRLLHLN